MNKQKIIILVVVAAIVVGGVGYLASTNSKQANLAKARAAEIKANITKQQSEGKMFNFRIITPASSYIEARNEISNKVLKDVLNGSTNLNNPQAIKAVEDVVAQIPDDTIAAWSQDGKYPIVETASESTPNSLFLQVKDGNKVTISYFVFENAQGQIASQKGNVRSITTPLVDKTEKDIENVVVANIMQRYPKLQQTQVQAAVYQVLTQTLLADIYDWCDQGYSKPVIVSSKAQNKILIQVPINYSKINVYISFENQGTNSTN